MASSVILGHIEETTEVNSSKYMLAWCHFVTVIFKGISGPTKVKWWTGYNLTIFYVAVQNVNLHRATFQTEELHFRLFWGIKHYVVCEKSLWGIKHYVVCEKSLFWVF